MLDTETQYLEIKKLALTLITSARKLHPYFQAHSILVLTDQPLNLVLRKPETSGRLIKWLVELGEFDITYQPRTAIKAQLIVDFISEFTTSVHHPRIPQTLDLVPTSELTGSGDAQLTNLTRPQ